MLRSIGLTPRLVLLTLLVLWPTLAAVVFVLAGEHVAAGRESTVARVEAQARLLVDLVRRYPLDGDLEPLREKVFQTLSAGLETTERQLEVDQLVRAISIYCLAEDVPKLQEVIQDVLSPTRSLAPQLAEETDKIIELVRKHLGDSGLETVRREVFHAVVQERGDVSGLALFRMSERRLESLALERSFREELAPQEMDYEAWDSGRAASGRLERGQVPHEAIAIPFEHDGKKFVLHMEIAAPERDRSRWRFVEVGILAGLLASVGAAILVALFMKLAVTRPIGLLHRAMEDVRDAGLGKTLTVRNEDQLGGLIRTFNDMTLDLRRAEERNQKLMRELQDFNRELERRVLDATLDLKQKNAELIATEKRLYTVQQKVSQLERLASLGQLSTTLAHELSTPLNVVLGHLDLLSQDPTLGDGSRHRVNTLSSQVNRLVGILKEMLTAVRVPDPVVTAVPLRELVEETLRFMLPATAERGIEVVKHVPADEVQGLADRNQAQQVLMNIVSNAIEATPEGGTLEVDLVPARDRVVVRVRDSGPGIPPDLLDRIFEPFFTTKALGGGTGLGLSISSEIMRRNGGTITVANHPRRGAVFEITFRAAAFGPGGTHDRDAGRQHAHR